ncbi:MAG: hypothetical protein B7Z55_10980, partial [Planctomycetales bacterium 12-60-4]
MAWKQGLLIVGFWTLLAATGALIAFPQAIPVPVLPIFLPLVSGPSPKLVGYIDIVLWLLAAEFAALVGWYRSHSLLDFSGRYRIWGWVAISLAVASFLSASGVHRLLAESYAERLTWLTWRRDTLAWLAPLALAGLATIGLVDRDIRRCRSSLILLRLATVVGLLVTAGVVYAPELECEAGYEAAMLAGRWMSLGMLVTALWRQACFVAYVCPDPPEKREGRSWLGFTWACIVALSTRWWISSPTVADEEAAPKRSRRRKKAEADGEEEDAPAPRRRRKSTATKTKRTTKPRTRTKPVVEEETSDEFEYDSNSEGWDASEDESQSAGEETNSANASEWDEDDLEQLEALTRPDGPKTQAAGSAVSSTSDDDSGDDDEYGGVDSAHGQGDMYKGLSKRQRRELKKK